MTTSLLGIPLHVDQLPEWLSAPLSAFLRMETYGLMSLFFILPRFPKNIRLPVWVTYGIYPAHLLIVLAFKLIFRG